MVVESKDGMSRDRQWTIQAWYGKSGWDVVVLLPLLAFGLFHSLLISRTAIDLSLLRWRAGVLPIAPGIYSSVVIVSLRAQQRCR